MRMREGGGGCYYHLSEFIFNLLLYVDLVVYFISLLKV